MFNNVKSALPYISAAVGVAGGIAYTLYLRKEAKKYDVENVVETFYSPEFIAFNKAQDVVSERMLSGYYDDKPDSEARDDYIVLYVNFLKN